MQNIDELLKDALSPTEIMSDELKDGVMRRVSGRKEQKMSKIKEMGGKKKNLSAAAAVAIAFVVTAGTVCAAAVGINLYQRMHATSDQAWEEAYSEYSAQEAQAMEYSRPLTDEERSRYDSLQKLYESGEQSPEFQIGDAGSALSADIQGDSLVINLPDRVLEDEDLLEIIDYKQRISYSVDHHQDVEAVGSLDVWKSLEDLTDEDVESYYLAYYGANLDVCGTFSRELSSSEQAEFDELLKAYEAGTSQPNTEIALSDEVPEEVTVVTFCKADERFYLPSADLDDEGMLQIIDFQKKADYSLRRISEQVELGERDEYPTRN